MQNEKKSKKQPDKNIEKQHKEENPWHVREKAVEGYMDQDGEEEEEENPWHVREKVVESYIEKRDEEEIDRGQWHIGKRLFDENEEPDNYLSAENLIDEDLQQDEEGYEEKPEVANQQSQLASHFKFMRQGRNQFRNFVAPAKGESEHASRLSFMDQLWKQYKEFIAPAKGESEHASRLSFMDQLPTQYKEFVAAVCFLSILPFPGNAQLFVGSEESEPKLVIGSAYFPLVGLVIALIACLLLAIGPAVRLPSLVITALVLIALVWLTGGLHLEGLMDTCDGLFGGRTRERKLEIMHDSHSGAFGVLGGVCILLLKFAIFASLDFHHLALALLIVLPIARWAMVLAMYIFPSALLTGLGAAARQTVTRPRILIAGITSLLIALILGQLVGLAVWVVGSLITLIIGIWVTYILDGLTGDVYGTIAETTEIVCFLILVAVR